MMGRYCDGWCPYPDACSYRGRCAFQRNKSEFNGLGWLLSDDPETQNLTLSVSQTEQVLSECAEEITRLRAENEVLKTNLDAALEGTAFVKALKKDAERYRWGLKHPSLMANYFIKWKTKHDHYNHRNPGVHPSEAIDAAMEADDE